MKNDIIRRVTLEIYLSTPTGGKDGYRPNSPVATTTPHIRLGTWIPDQIWHSSLNGAFMWCLKSISLT